jgi:hypothetical protein
MRVYFSACNASISYVKYTHKWLTIPFEFVGDNKRYDPEQVLCTPIMVSVLTSKTA